MQDQILDMLLKEDEITWQNILYDLIKSEQMDPWDVDISLLSNKYLETLRKMQKMNFFVSGKIILAASMLLKIKSKKLLTDHIEQFDSFLFQSEEPEEFEEFETEEDFEEPSAEPKLTIKTPQSRKKKVSIKDLVHALELAIEVDKKRKVRHLERDSVPVMEMPKKTVDISKQISGIYQKVVEYFSTKKGENLTFTHLLNSGSKEDKVATFIPLLHLENQRKVDINQQVSFGEIRILLKQNKILNEKIEQKQTKVSSSS
ncbi:segregation/condensation protein A [archaeon]|jgi:segregation and condensation protein A|nr:segregation/condensation protein A [archaeon]MBT6824328.1 segregation/condensation protein A [archaeon]MBT7106878.1 segregation/condensation protein A [archaeon]MBT7297430.1 segregation/condensation protein A [archaeon]